MLWLLALPVLMLLIWLGLKQWVFLVRNVEVTGTASVSQQDVVRLSGIRLGSRMDQVDLTAVSNNVESTGKLAFVGVSRRYPSTLVLEVRERSQDAIVLLAGKIIALDSDGYVVSAGESVPDETLPYVMGLKPSTFRLGQRLNAPDAQLDAMKAVLEVLKAQNAVEYVSELNVEDVNDLRILTRKGMTVLLGDSSQMNAKIAWMVGALRDLESRGENLGRLDVSSGNKADFLRSATPTPVPVETPKPTPEEYGTEESAVIGEDAI